MKLNDKDKAYLREIGYLDEDMKQIERATLAKYTSYEIDDKEASMMDVLAVLDRETYLSGIARSAFHWSAVRRTKDDKVVYFNSSKLFK